MAEGNQQQQSSGLRPVSANVISVVEREGAKCRYQFQINVSWSDGTCTTCYRGYQDFFDFQCKLLDTYPEDAGTVKGHARKLPYLPGKKIFRRSTKSLAMQRLPLLHQYLQDILLLPLKIISSRTVLVFLHEDIDKLTSAKGSDSVKNDDELLQSIEAVDMNDGGGVRFVNDRSTSIDDEVDEVDDDDDTGGDNGHKDIGDDDTGRNIGDTGQEIDYTAGVDDADNGVDHTGGDDTGSGDTSDIGKDDDSTDDIVNEEPNNGHTNNDKVAKDNSNEDTGNKIKENKEEGDKDDGLNKEETLTVIDDIELSDI